MIRPEDVTNDAEQRPEGPEAQPVPEPADCGGQPCGAAPEPAPEVLPDAPAPVPGATAEAIAELNSQMAQMREMLSQQSEWMRRLESEKPAAQPEPARAEFARLKDELGGQLTEIDRLVRAAAPDKAQAAELAAVQAELKEQKDWIRRSLGALDDFRRKTLDTLQAEVASYRRREDTDVLLPLIKPLVEILSRYEFVIDQIQDPKARNNVASLFDDINELLEDKGVEMCERTPAFGAFVARTSTKAAKSRRTLDPALVGRVARSVSPGYTIEAEGERMRMLVQERVETFALADDVTQVAGDAPVYGIRVSDGIWAAKPVDGGAALLADETSEPIVCDSLAALKKRALELGEDIRYAMIVADDDCPEEAQMALRREACASGMDPVLLLTASAAAQRGEAVLTALIPTETADSAAETGETEEAPAPGADGEDDNAAECPAPEADGMPQDSADGGDSTDAPAPGTDKEE